MSGKRPGRFGDAPPSTGSGGAPTNPGSTQPGIPTFGERRGAPLPLLTQPMMMIDRHELGELAEPRHSALAGPVPTLKIDAASLAMGKPTVTISQQSRPGEAARPTVGQSPVNPALSAPPQVDLTQHHLPDDNPDPRLTLALDPDSERSAAFRVLRHHLLEVGRPQVVIVSSPMPGDGKTTTAVNLALALAECGRAKTLLVETHVRRPQFTNIFKFVPPWCFAEQLAAHRHQPTMPWSMIDIPQLWLHVAAVNPRIAQTQLLDGPAFAIAMERLRLAGYDHIVVDAPPVLGSADVNLMADAADSVVFALRTRRSTLRDLRRALDQLGDRKVSGTILLESA